MNNSYDEIIEKHGERLKKCPWCGAPLEHVREYDSETDIEMNEFNCQDVGLENCPFRGYHFETGFQDEGIRGSSGTEIQYSVSWQNW